MKSPIVTGNLATELNGCSPSSSSKRTTKIAKHSESKPESNNATSSLREAAISRSYAAAIFCIFTKIVDRIVIVTEIDRRNFSFK